MSSSAWKMFEGVFLLDLGVHTIAFLRIVGVSTSCSYPYIHKLKGFPFWTLMEFHDVYNSEGTHLLFSERNVSESWFCFKTSKSSCLNQSKRKLYKRLELEASVRRLQHHLWTACSGNPAAPHSPLLRHPAKITPKIRCSLRIFELHCSH